MGRKQSKWQTEESACTHLQEVRGSSPASSLQLAILGRIISSWHPKPERILDIGCGDGILGRALLDQFPMAHVFFADCCTAMLDAVQRHVGNSKRATIVNLDFSSPDWMDQVGSATHFNVIVSGFAIHHQAHERKRDLYGEIFRLLASGGVFLNLEHVAAATPDVGRLFGGFFIDSLFRFHKETSPSISRREVELAYYERADKEENVLASVQEQCDWLCEIGFQDVDCFFKVFELALFGGRKTSNKPDSGHN
jgi:tRNA (cmo5U34)-methyltransferase